MSSTTQVAHNTEPVTTSTPPNINPSASVITANNTSKTSENDSSNYEDASNVRNSSTPVVSLLSLDQQQEKDFLSMQGGRRRKPTNPPSSHCPPVPCRNYPSNGFVPYGQITYDSPPSQPFNTYNTNHHQNRPSYNNCYQRRLNGFDNRYNNNKNKKKNYDINRAGHSNDHSSRSSLRTDSNSSASCVDENKNDEKSHTRTAVNTPPPAPYSPLANPFKMFNLPNYHITNNNSRNPNNLKFNHNRPYYNSNNNNNNYCYEKYKGGINESPIPSKNDGANSSSNNFTTLNSQQNLTSQVHVATSQGLVPSSSTQGFSGSTSNPRRSRRSIRRNGGGGGVNEIGAGDAPLLSEVGGEVCKKLETLKL